MIQRRVTYLFFYSYVLLVVAAGAWGTLLAPWDVDWLLRLDLDQTTPAARANVLSHYRFLRAMELAFGIFALAYRREIFSDPRASRVFLAGMLAGVLGRSLSLVADGQPRLLFNLFLVWEAVGVVLIYLYTHPRMVRAS